jgi:hypothetical protein
MIKLYDDLFSFKQSWIEFNWILFSRRRFHVKFLSFFVWMGNASHVKLETWRWHEHGGFIFCEMLFITNDYEF